MVVTAPNPIHGTSAPTSSWSTVNLAEAVPGPVTPLGWSVWAPAGERGGRVPFYAMGAIPKAMLAVPERSEDRRTKRRPPRLSAANAFIERS